MSILSELKKLTGKQNATVVSEALPESFGGGSPLVVHDNVGTLDKTMGEIQEAVLSGRSVLIYVDDDAYTIRTLQYIRPVFHNPKAGVYDSEVCRYSSYIYHATGETEAAALAAYPTHS